MQICSLPMNLLSKKQIPESKWFHFASYLLSIAHERREADEKKNLHILAVGYRKMTANLYRRSSTCGICRGLTAWPHIIIIDDRYTKAIVDEHCIF